MDFDKPAVVIDLGGHTVKAGFSCDNYPVSMFRNLVARPTGLNPPPFGRGECYDVPIGDEAVLKGELMELYTPVVNGLIMEWENIERVYHHIFYRELKVAPEDRGVMVACSSVTPMQEKIRCCKVLFEVLNCPAVCIQPSSVLSLYGSGLTTGCVVDLGYDKVEVNPAYEGSPIKYARMTTGYAGRQMFDYIAGSLSKRNLEFGYHTPEVMDKIVKSSVYVTLDAAMSIKGHHRYYKSSEGINISLSNEAFLAGEIMFQPAEILGPNASIKPLQDTVLSSIMKLDSDLKQEMSKGVVVAGGLSLIPGLTDRLQEELTQAFKRQISVITSPESNVLGWMGGSLFAGSPQTICLWVTRSQYDDHGVRIINNRFL